jgi:hypothetical protein
MTTTGGPVDEYIPNSADDAEIQPAELVTVKEYVPSTKLEIVIVLPLPVDVKLPGESVNCQVPLTGNPFITTLPVGESIPGWVIVPIKGGVGISGWGGIITFADNPETQPAELDTEKL